MDAVWHRCGASDDRPERQGLGLDTGRDESDAELPDDPSHSCVRSRSGRPDRRGSAGHVSSLAARTGLVTRPDVDAPVGRSACWDGNARGACSCRRTGVTGERATRRLAAILAADVAGYSRLIGADEEGTLSRLKVLRAEVIDPKIAEYHGRIVKTTGDGLLVEFASVVDALRCAAEIQAAAAESNAPLAVDKRIELRIGINVGDIFGDGSTSPPGSQAWPSPVAFAFRRGYARTPRASSTSPSAIWASSSSRTSSGLCAPTQSAKPRRPRDIDTAGSLKEPLVPRPRRALLSGPRSLLRRAGGGEVGTAVHPDFSCSASHSIEPDWGAV